MFAPLPVAYVTLDDTSGMDKAYRLDVPGGSSYRVLNVQGEVLVVRKWYWYDSIAEALWKLKLKLI
jgi:hypothetical protein